MVMTMRRMDRKKQEWKQEDAIAVTQARDAGGPDLRLSNWLNGEGQGEGGVEEDDSQD